MTGRRSEYILMKHRKLRTITDLSDIAALPDEEEVERPEMIFYLGSGDERSWADVNTKRFI